MRLLSFLALAVALNACASSAGVTIPARQQFILGEYKDAGYSANLSNQGKTTVLARVVDKQSQTVATEIELAPSASARVAVSKAQEVHLVNDNDRSGQVLVKANVAGVEGMRYVPVPDAEQPAPVTLSAGRTVTSTSATSTSTSTEASAELAPGQTLIIGEGSTGDYKVAIRNRGSDITVAARNQRTGERTQSFGLGRYGKETIYLRPNEELFLINDSARPTMVSATAARPVRGVRVTEGE